jgi:hypothetical protein
LKWALCDKFHDYLYGIFFQVYTDNNPLTYVTTTAKLDAMSHRWLASLSNYNFKLIYNTEKSNRDAEGLSRRPTEVFPDVIKAFTSAIVVEKEELPLAECIVLSENAEFEQSIVDSDDVSQRDFHNIDWIEEQKKNFSINRVIDLLKSGLRPTGKDIRKLEINLKVGKILK